MYNTMNFKEILKYFNIEDKYNLKELAEVLEVTPSDIKDCEFKDEGNYIYADCGCCEFLIFDNYDDVKDYAKERLYEIYEDCYEPEIPENIRYYVDVESWAWDAIRFDGVGNVIADYDGDEKELNINGKTFYIYRIN